MSVKKRNDGSGLLVSPSWGQGLKRELVSREWPGFQDLQRPRVILKLEVFHLCRCGPFPQQKGLSHAQPLSSPVLIRWSVRSLGGPDANHQASSALGGILRLPCSWPAGCGEPQRQQDIKLRLGVVMGPRLPLSLIITGLNLTVGPKLRILLPQEVEYWDYSHHTQYTSLLMYLITWLNDISRSQ